MLSNAPPFLHLRRMSMMLSFIIVLGVDHNSPEEDFLMQRQSDEDWIENSVLRFCICLFRKNSQIS